MKFSYETHEEFDIKFMIFVSLREIKIQFLSKHSVSDNSCRGDNFAHTFSYDFARAL